MSPTRRTYLRAGASALALSSAGCAAVTAPRADSDRPRVTLVSVSDTDDLPVRLDVEITRPRATEDHPPQLRTRLVNTSETTVQVTEGGSAHFEYATDESEAYVLLPHEPGRFTAEPGCWRLIGEFGSTAELWVLELPPDDPSALLLDLYGYHDREECLPTGTYRFETSISATSRGRRRRPSSEWGFEVRIE